MPKLREHVIRILNDKGYKALPVETFGKNPSVTGSEVALATTAFGQSLAGTAAKYVLIPVVDDINNPPNYPRHTKCPFSCLTPKPAS